MAIKRTKLAQDWESSYLDILQEAQSKGRTPARHLQALSPSPEGNNPNEPVSALGWVLDYHGVILRDNRRKGVVSTPLEEIFDEPHKAHAFSAAVKASIVGGIRSHNEQELAFGSADYNPGSAFRPWSRTPMVDGDRKVAWPPTESVIASVREQKDIQIPIYIPNAEVERGQDWKPGTDIPLGLLTTTEASVSTRWYADGITISNELRTENADLVMMHADKRRVEFENQVTQQAIGNLAGQSGLVNTNPDSRIGTDSNADLKVARQFRNKGFEVTTAIGNGTAVEAYLGIDRKEQTFYSSESQPSYAGSRPRYGRVAPPIDTYDSETPVTSANANDTLMFFDASESIDLYVAPGSEEESDTYVERKRAYEIAWTIRWVTQPRYPNEVLVGNRPVRLLRVSA